MLEWMYLYFPLFKKKRLHSSIWKILILASVSVTKLCVCVCVCVLSLWLTGHAGAFGTPSLPSTVAFCSARNK